MVSIFRNVDPPMRILCVSIGGSTFLKNNGELNEYIKPSTGFYQYRTHMGNICELGRVCVVEVANNVAMLAGMEISTRRSPMAGRNGIGRVELSN